MVAQRKRIGFLINHLGWEGHFTNSLWRSAVVHCRERDIDLLLYTGPQRLDDYVAQHVQSAVFRLVHERRVDGLVLNSGIRYFGTVEWQRDFHRQFSHIPMVSIAKSIPGIPAVLIDNTSGITAAVDHLVVEHGHRRQAFIRGPNEADDATVRFNAWIAALAAHGIEVDMDLVVQGDFASVEHPERLVKAWHAGNKFGAVIACSDLMAKDMIAVFRKSGIRVPEDVAVIGFDDEPRNRYTDPPLTSVFQSIQAQTRTAIDLLETLWQGQKVAAETLLPTHLHIRASCGCGRGKWTVDPQIRRRLVEAFAEPATAANEMLDMNANGENTSDHTFDVLTAMDALKTEGTLAGAQPWAAQWNARRSHFYFQSLGNLRHSPVQAAFGLLALDVFFDTANVALLDAVERILTSRLPQLGISRYCFSIIPTLAHGEQSQAVWGLIPDNRAQVNAAVAAGVADFMPVAVFPDANSGTGHARFKAALLAPDDWMDGADQCALVILPIASTSTWFGLLVCTLVPGTENLLLQLQAALALACERDNLIRRTTRQSLSDWSRPLVTAEKSKTTGSLVSGVAQAINQPLAGCAQIADTVKSQLGALEVNFASGKMGRQNLSDFIATTQQALQLLENSFSQVAGLVQTFKKVSASEYDDTQETFNLVADVQGLVYLLKAEMQARFIAVVVQAPVPVLLSANRNVLQEVVTELVRNAMDHAFATDMRAEHCITISVVLLENADEVQLQISDNGAGVAGALREQMFEPFVGSKPHLGHVGLGLAIVRGLVSDALGGSIAYLPHPQGGSIFEIRFPVRDTTEQVGS